MTIPESLGSSLQISSGFLIAGILIIVLFFLVVIFNGLIQLVNNIDKAWANIDVLLKKRLDLIPELVDVVKGYTTYEQGVLEEITKVRTAALQADGIAEKTKGSEATSASLKSVFLLAENYPDLKANANFLSLQKAIEAVETQIAQRREFYNDTVLNYNTRIATVPGLLIAIPLRFRPREYFRVEDNVRVPIKVSLEDR
jgi:LemA protein